MVARRDAVDVGAQPKEALRRLQLLVLNRIDQSMGQDVGALVGAAGVHGVGKRRADGAGVGQEPAALVEEALHCGQVAEASCAVERPSSGPARNELLGQFTVHPVQCFVECAPPGALQGATAVEE